MPDCPFITLHSSCVILSFHVQFHTKQHHASWHFRPDGGFLYFVRNTPQAVCCCSTQIIIPKCNCERLIICPHKAVSAGLIGQMERISTVWNLEEVPTSYFLIPRYVRIWIDITVSRTMARISHETISNASSSMKSSDERKSSHDLRIFCLFEVFKKRVLLT